MVVLTADVFQLFIKSYVFQHVIRSCSGQCQHVAFRAGSLVSFFSRLFRASLPTRQIIVSYIRCEYHASLTFHAAVRPPARRQSVWGQRSPAPPATPPSRPATTSSQAQWLDLRRRGATHALPSKRVHKGSLSHTHNASQTQTLVECFTQQHYSCSHSSSGNAFARKIL